MDRTRPERAIGVRYDGLDGLRGIAALVVVFHHWSLVPTGFADALQELRVTRPLVAGPAAVHLFFVLSGFVLFGAFERERPGYLAWAAKRLLRLWPPLIGAVIMSALLYDLVRPSRIATLSSWLNDESWWQAPSAAAVLGHIALPGLKRFEGLDNVIWSLVHEVRVSLILPLLAVFVRYRPLLTVLVAAALAGEAGYLRDKVPDEDWFRMLGTARYLMLFVAGAAMARLAVPLRALLARRTAGPVAGAAGLALIAVDPETWAGAPVAIGAVLLVACCAWWEPAAGLLSRRIPRWLGRVSYSLYLVHLPLLLALMHGLDGVLPWWTAWALVIPAALIVAHLFNFWIERPAILAARRRAATLSGFRFRSKLAFT